MFQAVDKERSDWSCKKNMNSSLIRDYQKYGSRVTARINSLYK
ncbi:hypothetical protein [Pseudodesulfovibrio profundus]|nr:hypothetical protein [Pseudodesulfovibrio profundus]